MTTRRLFLAGLGAIIASPAIVRAASLMPIKVYREIPPEMMTFTPSLFSQLTATTRRAYVPNIFKMIYDEQPSMQLLLAQASANAQRDPFFQALAS